MKRLTKKVGDNYCSQKGDFYDLYNKLGQLEDLEEEIGCPLEVVFKALINNVIYYQNNNGYLIEMKGIKLVKLCEWCLTNGNHYPMTKYYKSNWWLKRDKSE